MNQMKPSASSTIAAPKTMTAERVIRRNNRPARDGPVAGPLVPASASDFNPTIAIDSIPRNYTANFGGGVALPAV